MASVARGMSRAIAIAGFAIALASCSRKPPNATPEGAVREFTEKMRRTGADPSAAKAAYDLLSKTTQANLAERAKRYADASGKHISPEQMIAPQSYVEHFEAHELTSKIVGSHALVTAKGVDSADSAEIPCVFQDGGWRLDLPVPVLTPVVPTHRTD